MKRELKSIALFDDGSAVSNAIRLYFQKKPGFSVTRVYSREEMEHRVKKIPFDIIIGPAGSPVQIHTGGMQKNRIHVSWSTTKAPGKPSRSLHHHSFQFEIETPDSSLSYLSNGDASLRDQFDTLSRLLERIEKYHQEFVRIQADTELLQSIIDNSMTGILHLLRNKIQWANPESLRILGRTDHELIGKEFSSLFPDEQQYREALGHISRNRKPGGWGTAPCSLVRKTGDLVECSLMMRRLSPMNSQKGYLVMLDHDHERKYLERAVDEYQEIMANNEVRYLEILRKMDQIIIKTDLNGAVTFWNTRAEATFGYQARQAAGRNIIDLITDKGSRTANDMAVLLYDPEPAQDHAPLHVLENRKQSGDHLWAAWNTLVYRDSHGNPAGIVWVGQDISDLDTDGHSIIRPGPWKYQILEGTDVSEDVFDRVFHTAIELGRGGRESRKIGTSFVIGDALKVMAESRQCALNPFEGKNREQRMVQTKGNTENIKNLALLDGAFVIDGSGFIHASSRHLLADTTDIDIPEGLGTRHASVAAMTRVTRSVGIVVSESGGLISIFKEGSIVQQIAP